MMGIIIVEMDVLATALLNTDILVQEELFMDLILVQRSAEMVSTLDSCLAMTEITLILMGVVVHVKLNLDGHAQVVVQLKRTLALRNAVMVGTMEDTFVMMEIQ